MEVGSGSVKEEGGGDEGEEDDGNDAIHGEERGVEAREVVGGDDEVFPKEERGDGGDAGEGDGSEMEQDYEPDQQREHDEVHGAGDEERGGGAEGGGDAEEAGGAIVRFILAGVEDVEASDPEEDGGGEDEDAGIEGATDGDPRAGGRDAEGESEKQVGPAGEALGVGVEEENREDDGRERRG